MSIRNTVVDNFQDGLQSAVLDDSDYSGTVTRVTRYVENYLTLPKNHTPVLMILDNQSETELVDDGSQTRFELTFQVYAFLYASTQEDADRMLNDIIADVRKYCQSSPSLGDYVLYVDFVNLNGKAYDYDKQAAEASMTARLIYWVNNGTY